MIYFNDSQIQNIIIHKIGNKHNNEQLILSDNTLRLSDDVHAILKTFFTHPFKETNLIYSFTHDTDLQLNPVFNYVKQIFDDENNFLEVSKHLASYLFDKTDHPKIKPGEFYTVKFDNVVIHDEICQAIGLFKSENKDTFLKIYETEQGIDLQTEEGININKIDKACIIFDTEKDFGYKIVILDNINKNLEAKYWKDDFLAVAPRKDDFYQTQAYLDVCKNFAEKAYKQDNTIEKTEQVDIINKSIKYFNENQYFDNNDFEQKVLEKPEIIEAFNNFKQNFAEEKDIDLAQEFEIEKTAVKKKNRQMRSVIKLDKNFHIYIHGDTSKIEKGYDEIKRMNYYKLYYDNED